jgi:hypothetical protein
MNSILKIGLILFILFSFLKAWPQSVQTDPQQLIAEIIEEMSSRSDQEIDFTPIVEDLMHFLDDPINLNQCSQDDLSKLAFLSDFQIQGLWDYIQANGQILSIYELQMVVGFDRADIQRISPFVILSKPSDIDNLSNLVKNGRHEVLVKSGTIIQNQAGYKTSSNPDASKYLGSKYSLFTRYSYQNKDKIQWGIIADKDAGEQFFKDANQKGFDYFSGYIILTKIGKIKKLVVGDYDAEFGQGLTFWTNLSAGKSSDPLGIRKRSRGLVKHSSANENNFLRGVGITIPVKKIDFTLFGSYKRIDASLADSVVDGEQLFSSLTVSGLHRTPSEIANKDALGEFIGGGNILYNGKKIKAGLTFSHVRVDGNYLVDSSLYKLFEPSPTGRTNIGLSLDGYIKKNHLFGETAFEPKTKEHAVLIGCLFKLSSLVEVSMLGRSYSRSYTNVYNTAFGEGSGAYNENGIFAGLSMQVAKGLKLSAYIDIFSFPWLRYRVNAPSTGHEYMIQSEYRFNSNFTAQVRYRLKKSEQNFTSQYDKMVVVIPQRNHSARLQFAYAPNTWLLLRSRFVFSEFQNDSSRKEFGYVISQDIGYTFPKFPLVVSFRYAIFDTDSYNSRIYSYESDMLYTFSVPAYSSKGTRTFIMLKYSPSTRIDFWLRWSQTFYSDLTEIGQGLDLIQGNTKSDARVMFRVRF